MALVSFANMKLKVNKDTNSFEFGDEKVKVEVLKYLPAQEKDDLIQAVIQKAMVNGVFDVLLQDVYFNLYLVYEYSNINFTDKQKEDELKLYDILQSNGLIDEVINAMEDDEYTNLLRMCEEQKMEVLHYGNSAAAVIRSVIEDLPANAEAAMEIVNSFNKDDFQEVVNFAKAANGGRPVTAS